MASKKMSTMKRSMRDQPPQELPPSIYLQEKDFLRRRDEERLLKAEEYHVLKTKEFGVSGKLRPERPFVKTL